MEEQLACEATSNDFDAHQFAEQHFWAPYHSLERLVFAEELTARLEDLAGPRRLGPPPLNYESYEYGMLTDKHQAHVEYLLEEQRWGPLRRRLEALAGRNTWREALTPHERAWGAAVAIQRAFRKWRHNRRGHPSAAVLAAEAVCIAAPAALPPEQLSPCAAREPAGMRLRQLRSVGHGTSTTRTSLVHTATSTVQQHKPRRGSGGSSSVVALAWTRSSSMRVGRVGVGGAGAGAGAASARALLAGTRSQRVLPVAREAAGDADEGAQEAAVAGAGAQPAASLGAGRPSALRRAVRSSDPGTGSVGRGSMPADVAYLALAAGAPSRAPAPTGPCSGSGKCAFEELPLPQPTPQCLPLSWPKPQPTPQPLPRPTPQSTPQSTPQTPPQYLPLPLPQPQLQRRQALMREVTVQTVVQQAAAGAGAGAWGRRRASSGPTYILAAGVQGQGLEQEPQVQQEGRARHSGRGALPRVSGRGAAGASGGVGGSLPLTPAAGAALARQQQQQRSQFPVEPQEVSAFSSASAAAAAAAVVEGSRSGSPASGSMRVATATSVAGRGRGFLPRLSLSVNLPASSHDPEQGVDAWGSDDPAAVAAAAPSPSVPSPLSRAATVAFAGSAAVSPSCTVSSAAASGRSIGGAAGGPSSARNSGSRSQPLSPADPACGRAAPAPLSPAAGRPHGGARPVSRSFSGRAVDALSAGSRCASPGPGAAPGRTPGWPPAASPGACSPANTAQALELGGLGPGSGGASPVHSRGSSLSGASSPQHPPPHSTLRLLAAQAPASLGGISGISLLSRAPSRTSLPGSAASQQLPPSPGSSQVPWPHCVQQGMATAGLLGSVAPPHRSSAPGNATGAIASSTGSAASPAPQQPPHSQAVLMRQRSRLSVSGPSPNAVPVPGAVARSGGPAPPAPSLTLSLSLSLSLPGWAAPSPSPSASAAAGLPTLAEHGEEAAGRAGRGGGGGWGRGLPYGDSSAASRQR